MFDLNNRLLVPNMTRDYVWKRGALQVAASTAFGRSQKTPPKRRDCSYFMCTRMAACIDIRNPSLEDGCHRRQTAVSGRSTDGCCSTARQTGPNRRPREHGKTSGIHPTLRLGLILAPLVHSAQERQNCKDVCGAHNRAAHSSLLCLRSVSVHLS